MRFSKKRIQKAKNKCLGDLVGFRQTDGRLKFIRADRVLDVVHIALQGRDTAATRAMLCAESATDGSWLHSLVQALHRPAYVPRTGTELVQ